VPRPADAGPRAGGRIPGRWSIPRSGRAGSIAAGLAARQQFHQAQALVVVHLAPARDFRGGSVTTQAQAVVIQRADADAGAEHGAENGVHGRVVAIGIKNPAARAGFDIRAAGTPLHDSLI